MIFYTLSSCKYKRTTMKSFIDVNQTLSCVFLVVGVIALSAVAFNYPGSVHLKFGTDGIQLEMDAAK
jgi:hypothetical protein